MSVPRIVIVGAGEAGVSAAVTLRESGYAFPICIISDELHLPYERPPLSKDVLLSDDSEAFPLSASHSRFEELDIYYLPGVRVTSIDRANKQVVCGNEARINYDKLLLATGVKVRVPDIPGHEFLVTLRNYDDALRIKNCLRDKSSRLIVIGGGFIGLEVAASARQLGCEVTLLEAAPRILMRGVPQAIASVVMDKHLAAGVDIRVNTSIQRIERDEVEILVYLASGEVLRADCVVAGIGVLPNTELAEAAGLAVENGIATDSTLRTSDPDIYAVGDCCSFPHALYGNKRVRLESWRTAQEHGKHVARSILGDTAVFATTPWFWSDQYDLHIQVAGLISPMDSVIARDIGDDARMFFHLDDAGKLVGMAAVGTISKIAKDVRLGDMMIAAGAYPKPEMLADTTLSLKKILTASPAH
ncbi:3-phenylpropionate/trans-cinnamate dioxygenase ferredoxin reductase subunit [Pseudomonas syringae]|uniref:Ferredoxin--protein reductase n=1 Tax=Pseudomonas syringae pv. apii TaxID=81036 RepID=A0A3M3N8U5_9PSED|nr:MULTISPECIES: FAD-dependent oxidoreductase [Pseudomonas syringae group]RMN40303.1 hypothetical protein ALQ59_200151 [Pseudomonas syringae pv. apii]RMN56172.1 hypothetical protein ALQ58_200151 [Pseudomonas syringae pv. apii]RMO02724.1 Ferredoxin-- protein reductase [Pseudomonas syringae pv. apii]SDZ38670.1 3-phenylpropionate/trans-cinnamate dioxygenase ferredoxin reductase subunit [Pseudomonas syringae]